MPAGPENGKIVLLSFFYGAVALIWGVVILSWRFWSKPMVLIIVLALAQATVSVWRIIEQRQFSKVAVRLSSHTMYPKIGPMQADIIIENLYRAEALSAPSL